MIDSVRLPTDGPPAWPRLLDHYRAFVAEVERGYDWSVYEYANDLACRIRLQERLDAGEAPPSPALATDLAALDARLRALLLPTTGPIHGDYPPHHFWFHGVPRSAPEVARDVREAGLLR